MSELIKVTPEQLRLWQLNELLLLAEVDRICRKNGIKYTIDAGTFLGAVRHGCFIPWDDDADIMFKREEYEKFFEACKTDLDTTEFFLQDYRTDENYRWGHNKLRLVNTKYVKQGQESLKQVGGVCIDLIVDDNVPDNKIIREINFWYNYCIRKILYSELGKVTAPNAALRTWYKILNVFPRDTAFKLWEVVRNRVNKKPTKLISHLLLGYPKPIYKYGVPAKCFDEYKDIMFEGMQFMCGKDHDTYLTALYRDYMTPPPVEKRNTTSYAVELELRDITHEEILNRYRK